MLENYRGEDIEARFEGYEGLGAAAGCITTSVCSIALHEFHRSHLAKYRGGG